MQIHGTTTPSAIRLRGTPLASAVSFRQKRIDKHVILLDDHSVPTPVIASCISANNRHFAATSFSVASIARILANNRFPVSQNPHHQAMASHRVAHSTLPCRFLPPRQALLRHNPSLRPSSDMFQLLLPSASIAQRLSMHFSLVKYLR